MGTTGNKNSLWREAQETIANLLRNNNFLVWEERKLKANRFDILAKRHLNNKVYYLIFEIKHYSEFSGSEEKKFHQQLKRYLKSLIQREISSKSARTVKEEYVFIGYLVFTKEYSLFSNRLKNWKKTNPFLSKNNELSIIWKRNVHVFCSTPAHIKENLESIGLYFYNQLPLDDFFSFSED